MKFRSNDGEYRMIADVTPSVLVRAGIVIGMVACMFFVSGCPQVCPQVLADSGPHPVSTSK